MMPASPPLRRAALPAAAALLCAMTGCGSGGLVPVEGRVTFAGQSPPASGYVFFVPLDPPAAGQPAGQAPRSGTALFLKDGSFRVTTFKDGDGLRPGRYEARVECAKPGPSAAAEGDGGSAVPATFKPPEVTVPANSWRPCRIEIDVR